MSRENVEVIREALEAVNRREREAWLALHDPEAEFRAAPEWPEAESVRGREAVWDFILGLIDAWEPDDFDMVELVEFRGGKFAGRFRRPVRGKASGVADVLDYWSVFTFRQRRILRQEWFASREEALDAAGLSE